jgi:acetyl-CoA C-acetyltransferase
LPDHGAPSGPRLPYGIDMKYVLMAPIYAIPRVLKKQGISIARY